MMNPMVVAMTLEMAGRSAMLSGDSNILSTSAMAGSPSHPSSRLVIVMQTWIPPMALDMSCLSRLNASAARGGAMPAQVLNLAAAQRHQRILGRHEERVEGDEAGDRQ